MEQGWGKDAQGSLKYKLEFNLWYIDFLISSLWTSKMSLDKNPAQTKIKSQLSLKFGGGSHMTYMHAELITWLETGRFFILVNFQTVRNWFEFKKSSWLDVCCKPLKQLIAIISLLQIDRFLQTGLPTQFDLMVIPLWGPNFGVRSPMTKIDDVTKSVNLWQMWHFPALKQN